MYNVAICDDSKVFVSYIRRIIECAADKKGDSFKIYEYFSGEELVCNLDGHIQYDLLILDMQLGGINGDETAGVFREKFPYTVIVFCSGVYLPTVKSFKVTPFRYLLKSYSEKEFIIEMEEILNEMERIKNDSYIVGHYKSNFVRVQIRNILYIENSKRGSRVTVSKNSKEAEFDGDILIDKKLLELSNEYMELVFAHSSYLVNLNHVVKINKSELFLDNGESLTISRTYNKVFREAFTKNISKKY